MSRASRPRRRSTSTYAAGWGISLRHGAFELALLDPAPETVPGRVRGSPADVLINVNRPRPTA